VKPKKKKLSQKQKDISFLTRWDKRGLAKIHGKGFEFVRGEFLPAIERLAEKAKTKTEKGLVADSYYYLGDIHDFNHAPKAAIRAYKKGITFFPHPNHAEGFHREIGNMYCHMGKYKTAIKHIKKALSIYEDDECVQGDLECVEWYLKKGNPPLYKVGDWKWEVNELLAQTKARKALQILLKKRSLKAALFRARAYGVLYEAYSQLNEWKKIQKMAGPVEFEYADWFFLMDNNDDSVEFWKILYAIRKRIQLGVFVSYESLYMNYPRLGINRKNSEAISFIIAILSKDVSKLKQLSKKYPKWLEPKQELEKLRRKKR